MLTLDWLHEVEGEEGARRPLFKSGQHRCSRF